MQSLRLHTSTLYLFSLLSLSWGTSCSKGCRTDDWEDTNIDTWATMKFGPYDAKKSLPTVLAYGPNMHQERTEDVNWETYFFNILTWQRVPTFIFTLWMWLTEWWRDKLCILAFTHWKFRTVHRLLAQAIAIIQTLIHLCEWHREIHYSTNISTGAAAEIARFTVLWLPLKPPEQLYHENTDPNISNITF